MQDSSLLIIVILAAAVILLVYLRGRRPRKATLTPRRMAERASEEEDANAPKEPQWKLKDLTAGGKIHFSLPKGIEEDYDVVRRDRVVWPDEQHEYDLQMRTEDPNHHPWLFWLTLGVYTHAWLLDADEKTLDDLGLTPERLAEMRETGKGDFRFRDERFSLEKAERITIFEGGLRPGHDTIRWDFRNDDSTKQVVIQRYDKDGEPFHVYIGKELWLRDATIIRPRAEEPSSPAPETPATRAESAQPPAPDTPHEPNA